MKNIMNDLKVSVMVMRFSELNKFQFTSIDDALNFFDSQLDAAESFPRELVSGTEVLWSLDKVSNMRTELKQIRDEYCHGT